MAWNQVGNIKGPPGTPAENGTKVVRLTQAEFDALATKDPNTLYLTPVQQAT